MRSSRIFRLVSAIVVTFVVGGCAVTFDARSLGVPASMSEAAGPPLEGEAFSVNKKAVFLLLGIVPVGNPSLDQVLAGQLVDGTRISNLSMKVRSSFADILITVLTAGLVVPRTVTYEGVVILDPGQ